MIFYDILLLLNVIIMKQSGDSAVGIQEVAGGGKHDGRISFFS